MPQGQRHGPRRRPLQQHGELGLAGQRCNPGDQGGATPVTRKLPFDEWTDTFGTERLTGALLDKLTRHVHIIEMNGDSYRLGQSRAGQADVGF